MDNVKKYTINSNALIRDAVQKIDEGAIGITFVVDESMKFKGSVSDGDIRRAMLKGVSLDDSVTNIINTGSVVGGHDISDDQVLSLYQKRGIAQVPIVDESGFLIDIKTAREVISSRSVKEKPNRVFLMVGGIGSRLRPLTLDTPKPMLQIGGKPILQTIVENLKGHGFVRFTFCVNHMSDQIVDFFGNGEKFGVNISYIHEEQKLGTAGALGLYKEEVSEPFIVMNGDIISNINFKQLIDFHRETSAVATLCVKEESYRIPYGVINLNDHYLESIEEKPVKTFFINAGIYVLSPATLARIPSGQYFDMTSLLTSLLNDDEKVSSFHLREDWLDIGRREEFDKAQERYDAIFNK